ncbi:ankyrin repeat, bromo and BTB domain-containing protein DDB_G0293800-like [Zophobas morio]|jgi:hypothetical protein|uniref:ankyrin repeat, bromo and BTB domain-containing protein DDB_G0293800-like n=1 Tax=Zophobas morio TaxID=2755281 RepID=UPI003082E430
MSVFSSFEGQPQLVYGISACPPQFLNTFNKAVNTLDVKLSPDLNTSLNYENFCENKNQNIVPELQLMLDELPARKQCQAISNAIIANDCKTLALILARVTLANLKDFRILPLILAAKLCNTKALALLLQKNMTDVNCQDERGWTPLHWSSVLNNMEAVFILCKAGADVTVRTRGNQTAKELALLRKRLEVAQFLAKEELQRQKPPQEDLKISKSNKENNPKQSSSQTNRLNFHPPQLKFHRKSFGEPKVCVEEQEQKSNANNKKRVCLECKSIKTPQWRRGPDGMVSLCNACGLKFMKYKRKDQEFLDPFVALTLEKQN